MNLKNKISPQRHRDTEKGQTKNNQTGFFVFRFCSSLCLCVSDKKISHSTKLPKNGSQVAGYVVEGF
jgi:hypothetical protein